MKTAALRIRIEPELRDQFVNACKENDHSAAQVLRAFIRKYLNDIEFQRQMDLFPTKKDNSETNNI